jgi:hypothetical protein
MSYTVKVNFTIPQKILLFLALIETMFYSVGEYEFMRGELKKIKILFTGIRTSNPVNNIYILFQGCFEPTYENARATWRGTGIYL